MNHKDQNRNTGSATWNESVMGAGGKDIAKIVHRARKQELPDPPVTDWICLPEIVSVRYLAEIIAETTGKPFNITVHHMMRHHLKVALTRSTCFSDAVRVLKKYGIGAKLER